MLSIHWPTALEEIVDQLRRTGSEPTTHASEASEAQAPANALTPVPTEMAPTGDPVVGGFPTRAPHLRQPRTAKALLPRQTGLPPAATESGLSLPRAERGSDDEFLKRLFKQSGGPGEYGSRDGLDFTLRGDGAGDLPPGGRRPTAKMPGDGGPPLNPELAAALGALRSLSYDAPAETWVPNLMDLQRLIEKQPELSEAEILAIADRTPDSYLFSKEVRVAMDKAVSTVWLALAPHIGRASQLSEHAISAITQGTWKWDNAGINAARRELALHVEAIPQLGLDTVRMVVARVGFVGRPGIGTDELLRALARHVDTAELPADPSQARSKLFTLVDWVEKTVPCEGAARVADSVGQRILTLPHAETVHGLAGFFLFSIPRLLRNLPPSDATEHLLATMAAIVERGPFIGGWQPTSVVVNALRRQGHSDGAELVLQALQGRLDPDGDGYETITFPILNRVFEGVASLRPTPGGRSLLEVLNGGIVAAISSRARQLMSDKRPGGTADSFSELRPANIAERKVILGRAITSLQDSFELPVAQELIANLRQWLLPLADSGEARTLSVLPLLSDESLRHALEDVLDSVDGGHMRSRRAASHNAIETLRHKIGLEPDRMDDAGYRATLQWALQLSRLEPSRLGDKAYRDGILNDFHRVRSLRDGE